jgi:hypothetical protein
MKTETKIYYVVIGNVHSYKSVPLSTLQEAVKLAGPMSVYFDPSFITIEDQYGTIIVDFN